jgi:hypothetical protein
MRCDALIHRHPCNWMEEEPFLLWEIGSKTVIEYWVDFIYESNSRMVLWLEEVDSRILTFVNETFPLCRNTTIRIGLPEAAAECCTFLDAEGVITATRGHELRTYLPAGEPASRIWFKLVKHWLENLCAKGSNAPEIEEEVRPGVFVGHHCRISRDTVLTPPCWIGSYTTITGAKIGPWAVIGENCAISQGNRVEESYILKNTFLGRRLIIDGLVAGRNGILDHHRGTMTVIPDEAIIRSLKR